MWFSGLVKFLAVTLLLTLVYGCQLASESDGNPATLVVENDENKLVDRVHVTNEIVAIENVENSSETGAKSGSGVHFKVGKSSDKDDKGIILTLVAEIDPLEYSGNKLQATEIRIKGSKAYVSYNSMGEVFLGGVDVFDISDSDEPKLISSVVFTDSDINGLAISGSLLFLAAATSNTDYDTPAFLRVIKLSGGKLSEEINDINISSFAATDVEVFGDKVYVTSGANNGYVTVLNKKTLLIDNDKSFSLQDARGVDSDNGDIAIIAGSNGDQDAFAQLVTFDKKTGVIKNTFNLEGASIKNSKSTIEVKKDKVVLAMGDGGTQVVCLATGDVLKTIAVPEVIDLAASLTVANSATAYKRSLFMANGEAGIYVAVDDENIDSKGCDASTLDVVGKLQLDLTSDGFTQSVNHIVYRNDVLFVAAGLGGLKVIKVDDSEADEDNDDGIDDEDDEDDEDSDDEDDD